MGFYRIHRDIAYTADGSKTITINKGGGGTFTITFNSVPTTTAITDLSTALTACGISHTMSLEDFSITLSDGLKFYFGIASRWVGACMDGDYSTIGLISYFEKNPQSAYNSVLKYDMDVYTTESGGFTIEMSDQNFEYKYHILSFEKVYNPSDPSDYLWFSMNTPQTGINLDQSSLWSNKRFHKLSDLTDITVDPFYNVSKTVFTQIPTTDMNKLNVMFPNDYGTLNNYTLKELVYFNTISIPNYFIVNQNLNPGMNFDDGQYKYHILNNALGYVNNNMRIAVKYDTV